MNCQRGFTLLELVLTLALLSMVIGLACSFYLLGLGSYQDCSAQIDLQQNARIAMDKISSELKFARAYSISSSREGINYMHPGSNRVYSFSLRGRELEHHIGSTVTKVAYSVEHLEFKEGEQGAVSYTIKVKDGEREHILSSSVKPRNEGD